MFEWVFEVCLWNILLAFVWYNGYVVKESQPVSYFFNLVADVLVYVLKSLPAFVVWLVIPLRGIWQSSN